MIECYRSRRSAVEGGGEYSCQREVSILNLILKNINFNIASFFIYFLFVILQGEPALPDPDAWNGLVWTHALRLRQDSISVPQVHL